ncbi:hypothetical protein ACN28E_07960 [Archangium lansingense]|uniref:hypothetical protein n=1 Tax=Archangium lansingense TaxID=2995310 RepID=UPI003B7FF5D7
MAKRAWTIKGRLLVRTEFPEVAKALGEDLPLAGVRVKVSAKEIGADPTWDEWGEDITDANGNFCINKDKDKSKRRFQVRVLFKDQDFLKIYPANDGPISKLINTTAHLMPGGAVLQVSTGLDPAVLEEFLGAASRLTYDVDWITVHEDKDKDHEKGPGVVDLHDLVFKSGAGAERSGLDQRRHADLWCLARILRDKLAGMGPGLGYIEKKPLAIKYPHKSPLIADGSETAYADPANDVVFLVRNSVRDNFDLETVSHELLHLWAYQHSSGELGLAWQLFIHGTTHVGRQKKTWTAFHEAFAAVAQAELRRQLFNEGATIGGVEAKRRPFTRGYLKSQGVNFLAEMEHFEIGWISLFNLLLCRQVCELDMNGADTYAVTSVTRNPLCVAPRISFADLLGVFLPQAPIEFHTELRTDQMTFSTFLNRLSAAMPDRFTSRHRDAYLAIIDPNGTAQPADLLKRELVPSIVGVRL